MRPGGASRSLAELATHVPSGQERARTLAIKSVSDGLPEQHVRCVRRSCWTVGHGFKYP